MIEKTLQFLAILPVKLKKKNAVSSLSFIIIIQKLIDRKLICISYVFWRRQWEPTPVLVPGKSCGQRSLVSCSPWSRQESDSTEQLHFHFSLSCVGEGNDNPFQCSCLENPRDGGAWWAAVYGVAQRHDWSDLAAAAAAAATSLRGTQCCLSQ